MSLNRKPDLSDRMKNFSTSKPASLFFALLLTSFAFATAVLFHSPSQIHSNTAGPVHSGSPDSIAQGKNNTNAEYQKSMLSGDRYFNEKDYLNAKASYQLAIGQKPGDSIARAKLQKTMELLRSVKAQNILYDVAVASADRLFQAKEYEKARMEYENAGKILPSEQYPKIRINEIIKILVDQQVRDEEYKNAIAEADNFYNLKSFKPALSAYKNANTLKPDEKYPQERIAELTALINEIMAKDEAYNKAIAAADQFFIKIQYPESKKSYQQALTIKPEQAYPKQKIKEIDALLAKALKIQQDYDTYISLADSFYIEKKHREARENYFLASTVKPQENYPREMMNKVDKLMAGAELAARTTEEKYAAAVSAADRLLQDKNYEPARASYVEAGALKPSEGYPKTKIAEIDGILQGIAAQKALENRYLSGIQKGDSLFDGKSYAASRVAYSDALKLKPEEVYPKERITSIDKILAETALQKKLDDQYQQAIESADQLFAAKSYEPAKAGYTHASAIKPQESYPKEKIAEIDRLMAGLAAKKAEDEKYQALLANADKLLAAKSYEPARAEYANAGALRPEDEYPKTKMEEIDRIMAEMAALRSMEEKYASAVSAADRLLQEKNYDPARASYVEASTLKPTEGYPKTKIAEIDGVLQGIAAQKALENRYLSGIQRGDSLFAVKSYDGARSAYSDALKLKPEAVYPKERITAIDKILAETALQKKLDDQYQQAIESADQLFAAKSYEPAKAGYTHASAIKPQESYPKEKIAEIDRLMVGIAAKKAEDEKYQALLSNADQLLAAKSYEPARAEYANAGALRPEEAYPKTKMEEIGRIMAEMAALRSLEEKYAAAVTAADRLLQEKNYDPAKKEYGNALALKPAEKYPSGKIAQIDSILTAISNQKALNEEYSTTLANADRLFAQKKYEDARTGYQNALGIKPEESYPKEKLAAITRALEDLLGKQQVYNNFIADGDHSLGLKDYIKAKENFQQAQLLFPDETYPKERLNMITARMDSLYRANKAFYDKAVADGDKFFNLFEFDKAVDAFHQASTFLPMEKYPREMIAKITRTIAENAIADVLNSSVKIAAGDEKQFSFTPVNIASRKNNFIYLKLKNLSDKPFNILMRYGKDKQPNGGVVIRNLSTDGKVNERLVSVRDQDLWYRADNNWISLYPQGGDIEVSFIQVSRAK